MLTDIKNLIIDMDGVLWHGDRPIPGLVEFFDTLPQLGINYVLATNNASKTAAQYTKKLADFGVEIAPSRILTSALVTAAYLNRQYTPGTAVYIIGDKGLYDALTSHDFQIITVDDVMAGQTAALVVVGFNRQISYNDLAAGVLLVHKGAALIGTNPDVTFPSEWGLLPGAGAFLAFITAATGRDPVIIGKPGPIIFTEAIRRLNSTTADTAIVGDRLSTDIAGGHAAGIHTILLLSGISTRADITGNGVQPDYIFDDITDLAKSLLEIRD